MAMAMAICLFAHSALHVFVCNQKSQLWGNEQSVPVRLQEHVQFLMFLARMPKFCMFVLFIHSWDFIILKPNGVKVSVCSPAFLSSFLSLSHQQS
jgi:hypothetical protein